jgi:predicted lipoprotein with Yx(FWY)xxD motif
MAQATSALNFIPGRAWLRLALVTAVALAAFVAVGLRQHAHAQSAPTVQVAMNANLGMNILTDANGMTLYTFKNDTLGSGTSACTGGCAGAWPAFAAPAGDLTLPYGATGALGTITRDDGTQQVTYNGSPLYYFGGDRQPGDTNGQGIGNVWFAAQP